MEMGVANGKTPLQAHKETGITAQGYDR